MPSPEHETIVQMLTARPRIVGAKISETRAGFEQLTQMFLIGSVNTHRELASRVARIGEFAQKHFG